MKKRATWTILLGLTGLTLTQAQELEVSDVEFTYQKPASLPQLQAYKTFDVSFKSEVEGLLKKENENVVPSPEFGKFQQVEQSEELHIVASLYSLQKKQNANNNPVFDIDLQVSVTDRFGTTLYENRFNYSENAYNPTPQNEKYGANFSCVTQALTRSLSNFSKKIFGGDFTMTTSIAGLSDVKKKSELYPFKEQFSALKSALRSEGVPAFLQLAEKQLALWEKMTQFSESKKEDINNQVRRAAYQNLTIYHILSGKEDKAKQLIEDYKKIDKEVKILFGLERFKYSDKCLEFLNRVKPEAQTIEEPKTGATALSKAAVADQIWYKTIDGSVTIKDKRIGGTYNGLIKVRKLANFAPKGRIASLDADDIEVLIITEKDGKPETSRTFVSKIESVTDKAGKKYIAQKFSSAAALALAGNAGYYAFLTASYESDKVVVYRCLSPSDSKEWVIRKPNDNKGVVSGGFSDNKNLLEYFSDCPSLVARSKELDKKLPREKLAEMYSNCK